MSNPLVELGITSFGYAFGQDQDVATVAGDYVGDPERVLAWGCHTFHRAADDVTATMLAARAAQDALDRQALSADMLDLVVLADSEMPEYLHWDGSAALARELKTGTTQTLLLHEGCGAGVTGLGYVAGIMAIQPEIETALFVAVNRVSEFHRNRMAVNNSVHSDAAVAVVLRRGHRSNQWLSTEQFTDPEFCDWFRSDYGGAAAPVPPDGWSGMTAAPGMERIQEHFDRDPDRLRQFLKLRNERVIDVVDKACTRAGISRADLAHVIYINDRREAIGEIAGPLGLSIEHTNAELSGGHGHMGAADQLVSLGQHLERGDLSPGDIVALCGMSIGMRWCCTLVRI